MLTVTLPLRTLMPALIRTRPGIRRSDMLFLGLRRDANTVAVTKWEENSRGIIIVEVIAQTLTQATREALAEASARGYGECVVLPWRHSRAACDQPDAFSFSFPIRQKKERRGFTFR